MVSIRVRSLEILPFHEPACRRKEKGEGRRGPKRRKLPESGVRRRASGRRTSRAKAAPKGAAAYGVRWRKLPLFLTCLHRVRRAIGPVSLANRWAARIMPLAGLLAWTWWGVGQTTSPGAQPGSVETNQAVTDPAIPKLPDATPIEAPLLELKPPAPAEPWAPSAPRPDEFDWIELTSGEWLKGRFKVLQDRKVEFDSEELDLQTFHWKDVRQLILPHPNFCLLEDGRELVGRVKVNEKNLLIEGEERQEFPRSQLRGISPGLPKEINFWSAKASVGLTLRAGNTEQADFNVTVGLKRRTPITRLSLDYLGNFSESEGVEIANNHRASATYDIYVRRRLFIRPAYVEYYRDPFQNIARRLTAGFGAGYTIVDTDEVEWEVVGGPAGQYTRFESVEAGQQPAHLTPAVVLSSTLDVELTKRTDLLVTYQVYLTDKESGLATHHAVTTVEVEITRALDFDVSFVWDRTEDPQTSAGGVTPLKNDYRLTLGIGVDY